MGSGLLALDDIGAFNYWVFSTLGVAIAVIIVVWLIWGITKSALSIDQLADEIIATGRRIEGNTSPLFALEKTANLGEELLRSARAIEEDASAVLARAAAGPSSRRSGR